MLYPLQTTHPFRDTSFSSNCRIRVSTPGIPPALRGELRYVVSPTASGNPAGRQTVGQSHARRPGIALVHRLALPKRSEPFPPQRKRPPVFGTLRRLPELPAVRFAQPVV